MATNGAFPFRFRFVSGAFPESAEIGEHGPGKFEQEPLAKAFGNKKQQFTGYRLCRRALEL